MGRDLNHVSTTSYQLALALLQKPERSQWIHALLTENVEFLPTMKAQNILQALLAVWMFCDAPAKDAPCRLSTYVYTWDMHIMHMVLQPK